MVVVHSTVKTWCLVTGATVTLDSSSLQTHTPVSVSGNVVTIFSASVFHTHYYY